MFSDVIDKYNPPPPIRSNGGRLTLSSRAPKRVSGSFHGAGWVVSIAPEGTDGAGGPEDELPQRRRRPGEGRPSSPRVSRADDAAQGAFLTGRGKYRARLQATDELVTSRLRVKNLSAALQEPRNDLKTTFPPQTPETAA